MPSLKNNHTNLQKVTDFVFTLPLMVKKHGDIDLDLQEKSQLLSLVITLQ